MKKGFVFIICGTIVFSLMNCSDTIVSTQGTEAAEEEDAAARELLSLDAALVHGKVSSENLISLKQVNLVANTAGYSANRIDPNLLNAWGIAIGPRGKFWISANGSGSAVVYDRNGGEVRSPIAIPGPNGTPGGTPTGAVYNPTNGFRLPGGNVSKIIFGTEDGIIAAWASGGAAKAVVDRSAAGAVYKGVALAEAHKKPYLYATNFRAGTIEVFDGKFKPVTDIELRDGTIPSGFAPFGIRNIDGLLYVTYAKQKLPDKLDDQAGPGLGYVDVFAPDGKLVKRLASQGTLNAPWGLTEAEIADGNDSAAKKPQNRKEVILVGNFGDGKIGIYTGTGTFLGLLKDKKGNTVSIDGLWGLTFIDPDQKKDAEKLYFTAGPNDENDGLFGYLTVN